MRVTNRVLSVSNASRAASYMSRTFSMYSFVMPTEIPQESAQKPDLVSQTTPFIEKLADVRRVFLALRVLDLSDVSGVQFVYWHVMDAGRDSVEVLPQ